MDGYGRVCGLRGVNLSGNCKTYACSIFLQDICDLTTIFSRPVNYDHASFPANHDSVTFVGRPFPLAEAHEHFSRLRRWGFTFSAYNNIILYDYTYVCY